MISLDLTADKKISFNYFCHTLHIHLVNFYLIETKIQLTGSLQYISTI